jgi:hypothetical protein
MWTIELTSRGEYHLFHFPIKIMLLRYKNAQVKQKYAQHGDHTIKQVFNHTWFIV